MPSSHLELWLDDPSTSALTFRIKYAVTLFVECIHGDKTSANCGVEADEDKLYVPTHFEAIAYAYFALLVVMCCGFSAVVYANQEALIVKVSQPFLLDMLLFGCLLASAAIPSRVATESDAGCTVTYWLFFMGLSIICGTLLAKIWRTYEIAMSESKMRHSQVSVRESGAILLVPFLVTVLVLGLWTILDQASWERTLRLDDSDGELLVVGECSSTTGSPYIIALFALDLAAMFIGVILCFWARRSPDRFSELYDVNFGTFISATIGIIGIPVLILVDGDAADTMIVECSIVL